MYLINYHNILKFLCFYLLLLLISCGDSVERASKEPEKKPPQPVPQGVKLLSEGDSAVELVWDSIPTATNYKVYWSFQADITQQSPDFDIVELNLFKHQDLQNAIPVFYAVSAIVNGVEGPLSNMVRAVPRYSIIVNPLYPNAPYWNDYVTNDGNNRFSASGQKCSPTTGLSTLDPCIHSGEFKIASIPGLGGCDNLTIFDNNYQFNWRCKNDSGIAEVFSVNLNRKASLSSLLDFDNARWNQKQVTVLKNGEIYAQSELSYWWGNPIASVVPSATKLKLSSGTNIYMLSSDNSQSNLIEQDFEINNSNIILVVKPGQVLTSPLSSGREVILTLPTDRSTPVNFLWIEGTIDANGNKNGILLENLAYSRFDNVEIFNGDKISGSALLIKMSNNNLFRNINIHNSGTGVGIGLNSQKNRFHYISSVNNTVGISGSGQGNVFYDITVANNHKTGIEFSENSDVVVNLLSSNNVTGLDLHYTGTILLNSTIASNEKNGMDSMLGGFLVNSLITSNYNGVNIKHNGGEAGFYNLVVTNNNETGIFIAGSALGNSFHGVFNIGNNNYLDGISGQPVINCHTAGFKGVDVNPGGGEYGLEPGTSCIPLAPSTAILNYGESQSMLGAFMGKAFQDNTNSNNDNLNTTYQQNLDWHNFDNRFRSYGKQGTLFEGASTNGPCIDGEICQVWDWRLLNTPSPALSINNIEKWSEFLNKVGTLYYMPNAYEIMEDGIGNDNGLCESEEDCIFSPNAGVYQGEGDLIDMGIFSYIGTKVSISNVHMYKYSQNGVISIQQ